ncbi:hypothetical protein [Caballeronia sp. AZ7_KS35]|uniref:hypothetical protein n=1 Tax=Caballeronia sp. AZ7_KS35 TaxID=2921762 RepID=UPI002028FCCE|nr:hypothetical protein [Caballeronia sp. AZ7_KS35]
MERLMSWIAAARWRMSLSHCAEGLFIQVPVGLLFDFRVGALAVVVWYWSRKKLEAEIDAEKPGQTHVDTWTVGWFPWQWDRYMVLDVVLPAISSAAISAAAGHYQGPIIAVLCGS